MRDSGSPVLADVVLEEEISSATDTVRFSAIPTQRLDARSLWYQPPRGLEDGFAFVIEPLTNEGSVDFQQLVNHLSQKRLIGVTVYMKGNVMSVTDNLDTLSLLIGVAQERKLTAYAWGRELIDQATMAMQRLQASVQ